MNFFLGSSTNSDEKSAKAPDTSTSSSMWNLQGFVNSELIKTYRRDLEEFGSGLMKETETLKGFASRTVKSLGSDDDDDSKEDTPTARVSSTEEGTGMISENGEASKVHLSTNGAKTISEDDEGWGDLEEVSNDDKRDTLGNRTGIDETRVSDVRDKILSAASAENEDLSWDVDDDEEDAGKSFKSD
eukprot:TRINITY_DN5461_c0_g1_i1.p1 TRINITY_DN5461_c0_g1~~TRINITY_DN5461_c0_g1_i1.p1  ORF type:complete len:187 (+),score=41.12 TRINITY_DN5461_c0_g1_i1:143-703(+)